MCGFFFFHITRERYERVYIKLFMVTTLSIELEGGIILLYILVNILNYVNSTLFCTEEIKQNKVYLLGMCRGFSNSLFQDHI